MRLRRLDLIRYGKFTDQVIDFGDKDDAGPDLHIIYGLNEAGKSTAFSAYLDLLFGIEKRTRYGFLHQYNAMEVGAVLDFGGARHEFRRVTQRAGSLRDASGQPVGETVLGGALSGLTRDAYRMMFSLDEQTLEDGGNAILESKGDLGELLFSASAGLVDLSTALAIVATEADRIFRKRASSTEIATLKRRLSDLKGERDKIDTQASAYAGLVADLRRAERAYDEAVLERGTLKARQDTLSCLMRAAPLAADHARISHDLAALADLPRPPGHWAAELPALMVRDATLATTLRGKDEQTARLRAEIDGIEFDRNILRLADRIEALMAMSSRFQTAEADLPKRRAALAEAQARLANLARSAAGEAGAKDPNALIVEAATLGTLRSLLEEWSGIEVRLTAAAEETTMASRALDDALAERASLDQIAPPLAVPRKAALQAGVTRLRDGNLLADRRVAAKSATGKAQALDYALRSLEAWTGGVDALEDLAVPSPRQIRAWRDTFSAQDLRRARHRERCRELLLSQAEIEAALDVAASVAGAIGDEEARALREVRERAWSAYRERPAADTVAGFELAMHAVDAMAEARIANVDRLAEIRGLKRDLALTKARIAAETELLAEVESEIADLTADIAGTLPTAIERMLAKPVGEQLSDIDDWIAKRDRTLVALSELRSARAETESLDTEIRNEARRLAEAIDPGDGALAWVDATVLLQAADTLLAAEAAQSQQRVSVDKLIRSGTRILESRRKAAEDAAEAKADWETRWAVALSGSWLSAHTADRNAIRAVVDLIAGLPAQIAERDAIQYRVKAMEADCEAFLNELDTLHRELGETPKGRDPVAATALRDRRETSLRAFSRRGEKERELAGLVEERLALLDEMAVHDAYKSEILTFFQAESLADVSAWLERCAHRDRLEDELRQLSTRILHETESATMDAALTRLGEIAPAERAASNNELLKRIDDLDMRLQGLFAARSSASDRLAAVGGDDAVARIEAERRTVTLQIEDKALRYLHLRTGALLAERALQVYREKHRGSMMRRASDAFRAITRDAYTGLTTRPEKDREILIGLPRAGGSKFANDMSKGTRFQLYLALRLAGYEEFALGRQAVPFVADDIMETFDELRSEEVLSMFGKMSTVGQVIYLTHHRHLCEIARKVVPNVKIHELYS
ncbi:AAA family ATPase [Methylobacterium longum]|uniref:AAA family ATPase n=1 Tax=Methylobacterium longum TaxID=767694 RepID=A0ABT8AJ45_9HYPH|nr:AAA family ATPase [Methylobacterium longum]MDN3569859.1 AAA family ATPase [Methylobacterium longum]GJE13269.1 hypothetical protein FOHLNKBM_4332 [Methylobacterium longum]